MPDVTTTAPPRRLPALPFASRFYYGWVVVAACSGVRVLQGSLLLHAFGTYVVLLGQSFGWTRSELSLAFLLQRAESALTGPIEGWLVDRFGPRVIMTGGVLTFAGGFLLLSRVDSLVSLYIAMLVLALGSSVASMIAPSVTAVNWFRRRRALVLSLLVTGMALGGPLQTVVVPVMESMGWRAFSLVSAGLVLVVGLPLVALVRWRPEEYGLLPDGDPPGAAPAAAEGERPARDGADEGFSIGQALRTRAFWFLSLGHASALLVVSAVQVHMVAHINLSLGYSLSTAAFITALTTASMVSGTLLGGWAGDRFSKRGIIVMAMFGHMAAMLLVVFFSSFLALVAFAVLHGTSWGSRGPLINALRADYFGRASFGKVMGFSSMIIGLGTMTGPMFAGIVYDMTGTYRIAFAVTAVASGLASLFFVFAPRPPEPESR
ncbi:MAG: MFS transporter [Dehalococcoidia bacterium]